MEKSHFIYTDGKKWFYKLKGDNGLLHYLCDDDKINHLIVSFINSEGYRFYTSFETHSQFIIYMLKIPLEKRCFHEVAIENRIQKMRFDLDIKRYKYYEDQIIEEITEKDVQVFFDQLIDSIISEYNSLGLKVDPQRNILVFSSHGKTKWSYHIIVDGFCVDHHKEAGELFKRISSKLPKDRLEWLDSGIYSANHCLRILGSVKEGEIDGEREIRVKILEKTWKYKDQEIKFEYTETPKHEKHQLALEFERSFITLVNNCYPIPSLVQKQALNGLDRKCEIQADDDILNYAFILFQSIYGNVFNLVGSMGNMIMMSRNYASGCPICDRVHEHENGFLLLKMIETENQGIRKYEIYFDCRRSNGKRMKLGEKIVVDQKIIPKENVIAEKSSKVGFRLEDIEYVSKTSVKSFKK